MKVKETDRGAAMGQESAEWEAMAGADDLPLGPGCLQNVLQFAL